MAFSCTIALLIYRKRIQLYSMKPQREKAGESRHIYALMQSFGYSLELAVLVMASLLISWARVYLGYHSLSQVLVGAALGILLAWLWMGVMTWLNTQRRVKDVCDRLRPLVYIRTSDSWWPAPTRHTS